MIENRTKALDQIKSLYPLKFKPILKSTIWGGTDITDFKNIKPPLIGIGESWEISGVENNISIVSNGELTGIPLDKILAHKKEMLVGKKVYQQFGETFPLLIKFIDANDDLSIQVHPDDEMAKKRHDSFGKTEMWYVVKAAPGAYLYSGFESSISPDEYVDSNDGSFTGLLKNTLSKKVMFPQVVHVQLVAVLLLRFSKHPMSPTVFLITCVEMRMVFGNFIPIRLKMQSIMKFMIHTKLII